MAKVIGSDQNVSLNLGDKTPFDKLMEVLEAGGNIANQMDVANQRREANNIQALQTADQLLQRASSPRDMQFISNTMKSTFDADHISDNPQYNLLSGYISNTITNKAEDFKNFTTDAGKLMTTMYSKDNQFGASFLDLDRDQVKNHIDELGGKDGWAPNAMKIRTNELLPMLEKFQTLYKGKNPNQEIEYKQSDGTMGTVTIGNFMTDLRKYEDMIEATVMEAMSETTLSPGTTSRISMEEIQQVLQITGEPGAYDAPWFKQFKTEQLGLFKSMFDNSSKDMNTYLNSLSKMMEDSGSDWGNVLDLNTLDNNPQTKQMVGVIVGDPEFSKIYDSHMGGNTMSSKASVQDKLAQLSSDITNENVELGDIQSMFQMLGMTANDRRTMAMNGLRAWGGANYFEYISPDEAIPEDEKTSDLVNKLVNPKLTDYSGDSEEIPVNRDTFVDEATDERLAAIETKVAPVREAASVDDTTIDSTWESLSPEQKKYLHDNWDISNLNDFKTYTGDDVSTLPELSIPGLEGEPPVSKEIEKTDDEKVIIEKMNTPENIESEFQKIYHINPFERPEEAFNIWVKANQDDPSIIAKYVDDGTLDLENLNESFTEALRAGKLDKEFGIESISERAASMIEREVSPLSTEEAGESIYTFENAIITTGVGVGVSSIPKVRQITKTSINYLKEAANMPDEDIVRMLKRADVKKASQEITGYLDRVRKMNVEFLETYGKNMDPTKLATYKKHHDKMKVVKGQVMVWDGAKHVLPDWLQEKTVYTKKGVMKHVTGDPSIKARIFGGLDYDRAVSKFTQRKNILKNYESSVKGSIATLRANGFFDEFPDMDERRLTKILRNSDKWNFWKVKDVIRTAGREIWRTPKDLLKTLGKASLTIGPLEGAMLGWYAGEKMGLGGYGQAATAVLGTASMKVVLDKVIKRGGWEAVKNPLLTSKIFNIAKRKAPWLMAKIATKTAITATGEVATGGLGTPLAIAMGIWTVKDIYELVKVAPEIKDELIKYLNSEGEYAPKEERGAVAVPPSS